MLGARGAEARQAVAIGELHAGRTLHERLDDHCRELGRMSGDEVDRGVEASGIAERGRAEHGKAQRIEDVGAEAVVADGERAHRVAVIRAAEREKVCAAARRGCVQCWNAIFKACSTADAPSDA